MTCDWCGHQHDRTALCSERPRWSRRGFLAMLGAGVAGLMLPRGAIDAADVSYVTYEEAEAYAMGILRQKAMNFAIVYRDTGREETSQPIGVVDLSSFQWPKRDGEEILFTPGPITIREA